MVRSDMAKMIPRTFNSFSLVVMMDVEHVEHHVEHHVEPTIITTFSDYVRFRQGWNDANNNHMVVIIVGSDKVEMMQTTFSHLVVIMLGGSDHVRFRQNNYMCTVVNIIWTKHDAQHDVTHHLNQTWCPNMIWCSSCSTSSEPNMMLNMMWMLYVVCINSTMSEPTIITTGSNHVRFRPDMVEMMQTTYN